MKIVFANEDLRNECNNQDLLVKRYGAELARLLRQRLDELFNAEVLEDMRSLPHVSISGSVQGGPDLSLDLGGPYRLVFRPYPHAKFSNGGMDWNKIDSIFILGLFKQNAEPKP
ncbi:MAG: putative killer suppression protein HigA [Fibrobacteres bacterium]|nr:putative killer suppression protein HigA [Fibrobacterota bacterium]